MSEDERSELGGFDKTLLNERGRLRSLEGDLNSTVNDLLLQLSDVREQLGHVDGLVKARRLDGSGEQGEEDGNDSPAPGPSVPQGAEVRTTREYILELLDAKDQVFTAAEVVDHLARSGAPMTGNTIRSYLSRMADQGDIARPARGFYHRLGADHLWPTRGMLDTEPAAETGQ